MKSSKKNRRPNGETKKLVLEAFHRLGKNVSATARELGLARATVQEHLRGINTKPMHGGQDERTEAVELANPPVGRIRRFILTSAQNNTKVHAPTWLSLRTLAKHYDAAIMVGTYSYNTNAFGKLAVKAGKKQDYQDELWFDERIREFVVDSRVELGNGLVWCGEMNILPTAVNPLEGLETYSHRKSAIFPHAKLAMRSIAAMQGEGTKLNFTTGTVTQHNYIQKRAGLIAEHHHSYGAVLVEVNSDGNWWVRQLQADDHGKIQDLNVVADGSEIKLQQRVEAITWGDLHATCVDQPTLEASIDMLDELRPKFQFLHDIMEGASINRHERNHKVNINKFSNWLRGLHRVDAELRKTQCVLESYLRDWCQTIVPDSNHDGWWLKSWLQDFDYKVDPGNAELFLKLQSFFYAEVRAGKMPKDVNITWRAFAEMDPSFAMKINFLLPDESFTICGKKIECGMHGHLGPSGSRGTPSNLSKIGRRANTAHTHSAGIWDGLYVAGTSSALKWNYNYGPSNWSHSHVVTYQNGKRAIVTMYKGQWRA